MAYLPMAVYGLEVPADEIITPANGMGEIPAAFRITMAAIDPTEELDEEFKDQPKRATLKILRLPMDFEGDEYDSDEDSEDEEFDAARMEALLAEDDDEDDDDEDDDEDDEETNGGPSDPAKTKQARKAAAAAQIKKLLEAEGMDIDGEGGVNGINDEDEDEDEDEDDSEHDFDEPPFEEFVICTLDPEKHYQQTIDIVVGENERVFFKVTGAYSVFLTGNYIEPVDISNEDDDDEDEMDYDLEPDSDELEDSELDELDDLVDPRITEVDEEEEEEDAPALVEATKSKKGKNKRAAEEVDGLDAMIAKDAAAEEPKLSKSQQKKLKKNDGSAAPVNGDSKSDKKVAFAKNIEQGPTPSEPVKSNGSGSSKSLSVKTVQGVTIDERKIGTGAAAKKGDRVSMRYIGKLKDGKQFDANKKGKPFSFTLGIGEVIKGWDIGVAGIATGGERRLIIPANLGYGSKGAPPDIPPNAQLTFDIKCLGIEKK